MATHSVGFVVCDCEALKVDQESAGAIVTIWAPRNRLGGSADFAQQHAFKIIKFFESYFDVKFPLPKIDLVVVPNLEEAAVNNWGLVLFR